MHPVHTAHPSHPVHPSHPAYTLTTLTPLTPSYTLLHPLAPPLHSGRPLAPHTPSHACSPLISPYIPLHPLTGALQPHLRPGDTFVDFACGLNTFAPLLKDPGTGEALNAVAFDIFSPVDRTEHFTRTAWLQA